MKFRSLESPSANLRSFFLICVGGILFLSSTSGATVFTVKKDGTGSFPTIQGCANTAKAGDTCLVYSGDYPEYVQTKFGGTSLNLSQCSPISGSYPELSPNNPECAAQRITFKAEGNVVVAGFSVSHPFITLDGFQITGNSAAYGYVRINSGGDYCHVINNTIRDGIKGIMGIYFYNDNVSHCLIRGNKISNLLYVFLRLNGKRHLIEDNIFERLNSGDYIYLFGENHLISSNIFRAGNRIANSGNHPDFIQTFGNQGNNISRYIVFDKNWVQDLECAFGQINSGGLAAGILTTIHDYTFRNNIFYNISDNLSADVPGLSFINNTFYRLAYNQNGINFAGTMARGDCKNETLKNNVFVGGTNSGTSYYSFAGMLFDKEVLTFLVTGQSDPSKDEIAKDIINDLILNGYLMNGNGYLTEKTQALTDISQFVFKNSNANYKSAVYALLTKTAEMDKTAKDTFFANYNFVSGSPELGYPAKRSDRCNPETPIVPGFFCEKNGINGGDPSFKNIFDPLGPDKLPFTADDGLIPSKGSRLCGTGENGTDIGAYTCNNVSAAPQIIRQPMNQIVNAGLRATMSIVASGNPTPSYQWKKNGVVLANIDRQSGVNSNTLTINLAKPEDSGSYSCSVSNNLGTVTSEAGTLTVNAVAPPPVNSPPVITLNLQNISINAGQTARLSIQATGAAPLTYRWFKNGVIIDGAVNPTYQTPIATIADNGSKYFCEVKNSVGSLSSSTSTLNVFTATDPEPDPEVDSTPSEETRFLSFTNVSRNNESLEIQYFLEENGPVKLELRNRDGEIIYTFDVGEQVRGIHPLTWNGRNAKGGKVSAGIYQLILMTNNKKIQTKVVVVN